MQLLSRIAGAASAEELRKVQAEIEAALGFNPHATPDETHATPDETGQDNMQDRTRHMQDRTRPDETGRDKCMLGPDAKGGGNQGC